ncbi:kinase-like protein [Lentithecium fluviatile CBS 122367]|uniref:Kinase-like protein n=1 Tax=Lentithecium fluviatile CBS 122367 TaxID=1168545 RepID=A0A6G1J869_9PLEO|nr:kinase-like protein [Lentithecium fluviatile CBS 122367]
MRRTPATFQPYDRSTGTELSQKQQEDCQTHYLIIKAYIDGVESRDAPPIPWTRKKLRYPTADLLDAIERLADDIRQEVQTDVGEENGTSSVQLWAEAERQKITALPLDRASVARYQQAVNLLHEFVSRLADVSSLSLQEKSLLSPGSLNLSRSSPSSHASTPLSNAAASRASELTASSTRTASSRTSNELDEPVHTYQGPPHESEEASFEIDPFDDDLVNDQLAFSTKKSKATYDWVLEYLRGGWQSSSPTSATESTISPLVPSRDEYSSLAGIRPLQRIDSDNMSTHSEDAVSFRGNSTGVRPAKSSRPIPTMASRLRGRVGHDHSYSAGIKSSATSGLEQFKTPKSIMSGGTLFCTPDESSEDPYPVAQTSNTSAWNKYLRRKGLIPNPFDEMDWSGRGQHAEFDPSEEAHIPLKLEKALGYSVNALVESVRCRRIRLARKTVKVSRRLKREEAMKEVEHLQRLKHSHVIRVVGTYTLPRALSILLYPVADFTLDAFLESLQDGLPDQEYAVRLFSVSTFLRCLAKAVAYIHEKAMKHMDIKPKNLLIRGMHNSIICNQGKYKIYIADFGIARSYQSVDDCNTESPTAYTKTYAAPEVVAQKRRDQSADIFSLGAVYAEMLAVLAAKVNPDVPNLDVLHAIRESDPNDHSYAAHASTIHAWLRNLLLTSYGFESDTYHSHITELVARMLSVDPAERPTATTIVNNIPFLAFCCDVNGGSEPFEAADRKLERELYDRAMKIAEADARYWRCEVDGCVKVYSSQNKLGFHMSVSKEHYSNWVNIDAGGDTVWSRRRSGSCSGGRRRACRPDVGPCQS